MILSHRYRFIAFKTRKTAGTSLEITLSRHMSGADIVTPIAPDDEAIRKLVSPVGPQNYLASTSTGTARALFYNHITADEVRSIIDRAVFDDYFKVAIVRNPFDYVVSWFFWECRHLKHFSKESFQSWLIEQYARRSLIESDHRAKRRPNPGVFASNRTITHIDGACVMNFLIRYEHLQDDLQAFASHVGLPASIADDLTSVRAKGHYRPKLASAAVMFDGFPDGVDLVRQAFSEEIDQFGYTLELV